MSLILIFSDSTFVLAVGRLIRGYVSGLVERIFYENLESVDLLYKFVLDIYLARHHGDLALEESLYKELLKIYSDMHVLQIWGAKEKTE